MILLYLLVGTTVGFIAFTLFLTYLVQQIPRNPITNPPDWGTVTDTTIAAVDGRQLEVWRIEPEGPSKGIVVFAHGWGRNRDRMVDRARLFGTWGFTAVIHSARDHGRSSPKRLMNALRFAEDIEAVIDWVKEPVMLYGHSAGSAGAIIAAERNPSSVSLLFLEASYAFTKPALLSLYRWVNPVFGKVFGPVILFWMDIFYRGGLDQFSPARLASGITMPVMLIHGENDQRFPLSFAKTLEHHFVHDRVVFYLARKAGHSNSSRTPAYPAAVKAFIDRYYRPHLYLKGSGVTCKQKGSFHD